MTKLKSLEELRRIKEQSKPDTKLRTAGENADRTVVSVGMATCGIAAGARPVMNALLDSVNQNKLDNVVVTATGCLGYCYAEPLVVVTVPGQETVRYANVDEALAREIISRHVMNGEVIAASVLRGGGLS